MLGNFWKSSRKIKFVFMKEAQIGFFYGAAFGILVCLVFKFYNLDFWPFFCINIAVGYFLEEFGVYLQKFLHE